MYQNNTWLDSWVGSAVLVRYLAGEEHSVEDISRGVIATPQNILISQPEVHIGVHYLAGYDQFGIQVRGIDDNFTVVDSQLFIPWGAVLAIQGEGRVKVTEA